MDQQEIFEQYFSILSSGSDQQKIREAVQYIDQLKQNQVQYLFCLLNLVFKQNQYSENAIIEVFKAVQKLSDSQITQYITPDILDKLIQFLPKINNKSHLCQAIGTIAGKLLQNKITISNQLKDFVLQCLQQQDKEYKILASKVVESLIQYWEDEIFDSYFDGKFIEIIAAILSSPDTFKYGVLIFQFYQFLSSDSEQILDQMRQQILYQFQQFYQYFTQDQKEDSINYISNIYECKIGCPINDQEYQQLLQILVILSQINDYDVMVGVAHLSSVVIKSEITLQQKLQIVFQVFEKIFQQGDSSIDQFDTQLDQLLDYLSETYEYLGSLYEQDVIMQFLQSQDSTQLSLAHKYFFLYCVDQTILQTFNEEQMKQLIILLFQTSVAEEIQNKQLVELSWKLRTLQQLIGQPFEYTFQIEILNKLLNIVQEIINNQDLPETFLYTTLCAMLNFCCSVNLDVITQYINQIQQISIYGINMKNLHIQSISIGLISIMLENITQSQSYQLIQQIMPLLIQKLQSNLEYIQNNDTLETDHINLIVRVQECLSFCIQSQPQLFTQDINQIYEIYLIILQKGLQLNDEVIVDYCVDSLRIIINIQTIPQQFSEQIFYMFENIVNKSEVQQNKFQRDQSLIQNKVKMYALIKTINLFQPQFFQEYIQKFIQLFENISQSKQNLQIMYFCTYLSLLNCLKEDNYQQEISKQLYQNVKELIDYYFNKNSLLSILSNNNSEVFKILYILLQKIKQIVNINQLNKQLLEQVQNIIQEDKSIRKCEEIYYQQQNAEIQNISAYYADFIHNQIIDDVYQQNYDNIQNLLGFEKQISDFDYENDEKKQISGIQLQYLRDLILYSKQDQQEMKKQVIQIIKNNERSSQNYLVQILKLIHSYNVQYPQEQLQYKIILSEKQLYQIQSLLQQNDSKITMIILLLENKQSIAKVTINNSYSIQYLTDLILTNKSDENIQQIFLQNIFNMIEFNVSIVCKINTLKQVRNIVKCIQLVSKQQIPEKLQSKINYLITYQQGI